MLATASSTHAQRLPRWLAPDEHRHHSSTVQALRDTAPLGPRPSTFGERALVALGASLGTAVVIGAAYGRDGPPAEIFVPGYALSAALGSELMALPREGARPMGALWGAMAGTAVGLLALEASGCDGCEAPPPSIWFGVIGYVLGVPLAASAGHGLESHARGHRPPGQPDRAARGATLRLERVDGTRAAGQVIALTDSTVALRRWIAVTARGTVYDTLAFRLDSVSHAWIRVGTDWQRGAVIGAGIGAGLGLAGLALDRTGGQAGTAVVLAVLGGTLGGLIGGTASRWEPTTWPPPRHTSDAAR